MARIAVVIASLLIALSATTAGVSAQSDALSIELNRLEQRDDGCRVHLVLENPSAHPYSSYRLDLVIFAVDGIIARRLALETAPLHANKTMVKEFAIEALACSEVGRILLNDVSTCRSEVGDIDDCVATTRLSSRASVSFIK